VKTGSASSLPWFSQWNYSVFERVFSAIPHRRGSDWAIQFLVHYPSVCTWVFGLAFLLLWIKTDEQTSGRRIDMVKSAIAIGLALVITLIFRPWIAWPAPVKSEAFRALFPPYLWGEGSSNSFPSHSTLVYFMVSVGFWPISRKVSLALAAWTLVFVSFPRMYLGGHYPIDVVFSVVLGLMIIVAIWNWPIISNVGNWLILESRQTRFRNALLFLWIIELGDGFRGAEFLAKMTIRLASRI
jgi:membrane-associated phospholipid phosphatase